jgi:uncharacterized protein YkwD
VNLAIDSDNCGACDAACPTGTRCSAGECTGTDVPSNDYCEPTADWDPSWAELEWEIVELVNQRRAEGASCGEGSDFGPTGPLQMDARLQCAARIHAMDMGERDFFSHDNPDGLSPPDRLALAGYSGWTSGENIAAGSSTAPATMQQWMTSESHCALIMSPNFSIIGVGFHPATYATFDEYWTQTFGD